MATTADILQAAQQVAKNMEAEKQARQGLASNVDPMTTPLSQNLNTMERAQRQAQVQNRGLTSVFGSNTALSAGGAIGFRGRLTPDWIDTQYTSIPVELFDSETGKVTKRYNNILDYQMDTMVVSGGAEARPKLSAGDLIGTLGVEAAFKSALAGNIAPKVPGIQVFSRLAGAGVGTIMGLESVAGTLNEAYEQFWNDPNRTVELLAEKDSDGVYKINYAKSAYGNALSGGYVKELQTGLDDPISWNEAGDRLVANVLPSFAATDTYKERIAELASRYKGTTKATDTDGSILKAINEDIAGLQARYLIDQQRAAALKAKYPNASEDAIELSIDNMLTGYVTKEENLKAPMYVFNGAGQITETTAESVFNAVYDLGGDKIAKDKYLGKLYAYLEDPAVSDDDKAIIDGQLQAIYAAAQNSKLKYNGMLTKDWADYVGQVRILTASLNDTNQISNRIAIATGLDDEESYGELKFFLENEAKKTLTNIVGVAINFWASAQVMNGLENINRRVLGSVAGKLAAKAGVDSVLGKTATWVASNAANSEAFTTVAATTTKELASKAASMAFDFTMQAVADAQFDLAKLGVQSLAGNEMDFWSEFAQDLALDSLFTFAHSGIIEQAFADYSSNEYSVDALNRIIRDNGKVTIDQATGVKTLKFSVEGKGDYEVSLKKSEQSTTQAAKKDKSDVKGLTAEELGMALTKSYYEVNYEAQKAAAESLVKFADKHPLIYKGYSTFVDSGIKLKMLGYRTLAESGDYTDLVKLSNATNSSRAVSEAWRRFETAAGAKGLQELQKASIDFTSATGRKKLSDTDSEYINASQQMLRTKQDYAKDSAEYKRAEGLYNEALSKVSPEDKVALDKLMKSLATVAKQAGAFETKEGLQTSNFFENIQKYNGYIPMFAKRDLDGAPKVVDYRRTHRSSEDYDVRLAPNAFQNPVESTMQYLNAVVRNAARAKQVNDVLDVISKYSGIEVSDQSTFRQDYEKLPVAELVEKYDIPKEARAAMHKLADTEESYKKQIDDIVEKNMVEQHVKDYRNAMEELDKSGQYKKWHTVEGDPILRKTYGAYKQGMTEADIKEVFLENMRESMEGIMAAAKRRNGKFRKYFIVQGSGTRIDQFMQKLEKNLDKYSDGQIGKLVGQELKDAMPMVSYNELVYNWIDRSSTARNEELLNDPEILSGEAGYDIKKGRKVKRADASVRVMTDGRIDTIYLNGTTKEGTEAAKGIAEVLNAPLQQPQKNAIIRAIGSIFQTTAQLKRMNVSGLLPSRAAVNLARDTQEAWRTVGTSAVLDPAKVFGAFIDPSQYSEAELQKIYNDLSSIKQSAQGYTEAEIAKLYRQGALKAATTLAGRPEAPSFEDMVELRGGSRTANQIAYQWKVLQYNFKNFGKGGAMDVLMTPGNIAEAMTRARAGQNAYLLELRNSLEAGKGLEQAMVDAYNKGIWSARMSTTDFSTKGTFTNWAARFTPFSYSSFSNFASKVEAYIMDPMGVSSRTVLSTLAYAMNLAAVLATEDNRKRYMNMSDYQRTHSILVDLGDGNLLTVPIDEEYAGLLTPFRTLIETLAYKEPVTFWKVFGSVLNMGPLDLSGFTEGDYFNLQRGLEVLGDTYLPTIASAIGEQITGRDWYYGSKISVDDRDLATYGLSADSKGDYVESGKDNIILHTIADVLHIPQWRIQQAFSLFTGSIGNYALHYLDKLMGATENEAYGNGIAQAFYKSFLPSTSGGSSAFYNGIDALYEEKAKLQAKLSANWNSQLTATGAALIELQQERQKLLDDFALKVTDFVSGYLNVYEQTGGLTQSQANRIYYLFDFTDTFKGGGFNVGTAGSEAYEDVKTQAGIQASALQAQAIGKYYDTKGLYQASDGTWQRETPLGTQAMNRLMNNRNQDFAAQINRIAAENNLSRGRSSASNQIQAIYDRANSENRKLTNDEFSQIDAIRAAWDVKAFEALAPFFQANGLDMISSSAVAEALGQYFLVIGDFETNNKGRYISASNLNKQRGFVQAFVRTIYQKLGY